MGHFTVHPKVGTTIKAEEVAEHFKKISSYQDRVESGFGLTYSGTSLSATLNEGKAFIAGYEVGEAGNGGETLTLSASTTNYIFLDDTGAVTVNQTNTAPTGVTSILLWTATTNASGVTSVSDKRPRRVGIDAALEATKVKATSATDAALEGGYAHLEKAAPFVRLKDTATGGVTGKLISKGGLAQLTDDAETTNKFVFDITNNRMGIGVATEAGVSLKTAAAIKTAGKLISTATTGAPLEVASDTVVTNLNAQKIGGKTLTQLQSDFVDAAGDTMTGNLTLNNTIALRGKNSTGTAYNLINVSSGNKVIGGDVNLPLELFSSVDPTIKVGAAAVTTMWHDGNTDARVTTAKIAGAAVTSAKISSSATDDTLRAITTDHIKNAAVTTAKLADLSITTTKIAADAVTAAKIAASNVVKNIKFGTTGTAMYDAVTVTKTHIEDALGYTPANSAGQTMSGNIDMAGHHLVDAGLVTTRGPVLMGRDTKGLSLTYASLAGSDTLGAWQAGDLITVTEDTVTTDVRYDDLNGYRLKAIKTTVGTLAETLTMTYDASGTLTGYTRSVA